MRTTQDANPAGHEQAAAGVCGVAQLGQQSSLQQHPELQQPTAPHSSSQQRVDRLGSAAAHQSLIEEQPALHRPAA